MCQVITRLNPLPSLFFFETSQKMEDLLDRYLLGCVKTKVQPLGASMASMSQFCDFKFLK